MSPTPDLPQLQFSPDTTKLFAALSAFQAEQEPIRATQQAKVKTKSGEYGYTYASFDIIKDATRARLASHNLVVAHFPISRALIYRLVETTENQYAQGQLDYGHLIPADARPQDLVALITYLKRITYTAILGITIIGEDDDAAKAAQRANAPKINRARVQELETLLAEANAAANTQHTPKTIAQKYQPGAKGFAELTREQADQIESNLTAWLTGFQAEPKDAEPVTIGEEEILF